MSALNVKVGDKGRYRGTHSECEVVFVKGNGCFVTSGGDFMPQVHTRTGEEVRNGGTFDFIPTPRTVRVAVWLDEFCNPHCTLRPVDNTAPRYVETIVTLTVPQ